MVEEYRLAVVSIPVSTENGRYLLLCERLVEALWRCDILIIGYTTIFSDFLIIESSKEMSLISVSEIRTVKRVVKMRCALVAVISTTLYIVELKSHTKSLAGIDGKQCFEMVLTICPVTS